MKFSVVIPLYNKQDTIRRAVYSVLAQVVSDATQLEIVIIDDGSTDSSLNIVREIQRQNLSCQIIVYSQKNSGVSVARNKGVELASSNFIAFLDADDTYEVNFISEIKSLVTKYPGAGMFATGYSFVDANTAVKRPARLLGLNPARMHQCLNDFFYSAAHGDLPITSSSVCLSRAALNRVGGFPVGENMGEDQHVWAQVALNHTIAVSTKRCANYFEACSDSLMQTVSAGFELPFSERLQSLIDHGRVPSEKVISVQQYIAGHLLDLVRRNLESGDFDRARRIILDPRVRCLSKRYIFWRFKLTAISLFRLRSNTCVADV